MFPYEDFDNSSSLHTLSNAEEIIEIGWKRKDYPLVSLLDIPWKLTSHQERSWNYHIQCLDMIDWLLRAYSLTSEAKYLLHAIPVALDWIRSHPREQAESLSPFVWYDMSVGMRAYRLAYILDAGNAAGLIEEDSQVEIWKALIAHQQYLSDDKNISFHNNHGYYQIAGQLAMARRFVSTSPLMEASYNQGQERLKRILTKQFSIDGVHREHSPDYHRMIYDTLRAMINSGLTTDRSIIEFAGTIEKALAWFVLPDQHIANFGDSDYRSMSRSPDLALAKWQTEEMRFVASGGKIGAPPHGNFKVFTEGGYFVARKSEPGHDNAFSRTSYLAQMCAFHSRTHKHADDLSFIWYDKGMTLLVDSGRYGYIGKTQEGSELWADGHWYSDPARVYCESTRAHNALEFDNRNYERKGRKPYGSAIKRWAETEAGVMSVEAEVRHFRSIRHARVLIFMPSQWLIVFDWFHDNLATKHSVKQWFHLAPKLPCDVNAQGYLVALPAGQPPLRIEPLLDGVTPSVPIIGQKPELQGWWSPRERELIPSFTFNYAMSGVRSGSLATLFSFSDGAVNKGTSVVSASGRSGTFRWKDDAGEHIVKFFRGTEDPDFTVDYQLKRAILTTINDS